MSRWRRRKPLHCSLFYFTKLLTFSRIFFARVVRRHHAGLSWIDHHLYRLAVVHGSIAVRYCVEPYHTVEDPAGVDLAVEDEGQKLLDIRPYGSRPAAYRD